MSSLFRRESDTSKILKHYQKHFEVPGEEVPVDAGELKILKFRCPNCVRLVTLGMSGQPMPGPPSQPFHAELMISFPQEPPEWAPRLLAVVALYPFQTGVYMMKGLAVFGFPRFLEVSPHDAFFLSGAASLPNIGEFMIAKFSKKIVFFFSLIPLHPEELAYHFKSNGNLEPSNALSALETRFDEYLIDDLVREDRLNVCYPKLLEAEHSLSTATISLRNQNPSLAGHHLTQAAQAFEEMDRGSWSMALHALAQEMGAPATADSERLAAQGHQIDEAYLLKVRRKLAGLDFPPLPARILEHGEQGARLILDGLNNFFTMIVEQPVEELLRTNQPEEVLRGVKSLAGRDRELWTATMSTASLWAYLETHRADNDALELVYRAVLEKGGALARDFQDLRVLWEQLQMLSDATLDVLVGSGSPEARPGASGGLWASGRLTGRTDWTSLVHDPLVFTLCKFVLSAVVIGIPQALSSGRS